MVVVGVTRHTTVILFVVLFISLSFPSIKYIKQLRPVWVVNTKELTCFCTPLSCWTLMMSEAVRPLY